MDAGEIAQCAQMRDEEWDVLYVTSIASSLHSNNFLTYPLLASRFIQNALPRLNDPTHLLHNHEKPPSSSIYL
jgi:hypothetical protein